LADVNFPTTDVRTGRRRGRAQGEYEKNPAESAVDWHNAKPDVQSKYGRKACLDAWTRRGSSGAAGSIASR